MVGPNPYPVHSFRELRAVLGQPYVVCGPCRRFVALGAWFDRRDTRATTFSCSVCGGAGDVVLEDPAREGLQHDPRPTPMRHRLATVRLRALHQHHASRFGRRDPPRESQAREKPPPEPMPRAKLVPLPIQTFREALEFGLGLRVHCPGCHDWQRVELAPGQLERPFAGGARLVCARVKRKLYGDGTEVCGSTGEPVFGPAAPRDPDRTVVDLQCGGTRRHPHPRWEIAGIELDAPPWAGRLGDGERFRCPGCGGTARHTFHVPYQRNRPIPLCSSPS